MKTNGSCMGLKTEEEKEDKMGFIQQMKYKKYDVKNSLININIQ